LAYGEVVGPGVAAGVGNFYRVVKTVHPDFGCGDDRSAVVGYVEGHVKA